MITDIATPIVIDQAPPASVLANLAFAFGIAGSLLSNIPVARAGLSAFADMGGAIAGEIGASQ